MKTFHFFQPAVQTLKSQEGPSIEFGLRHLSFLLWRTYREWIIVLLFS